MELKMGDKDDPQRKIIVGETMKTKILISLIALALGSVLSACAQNGTTAPAADGKKIIGAKVRIKSEKVDTFVAAAKTIIEASRAEPGNISYTLYQDPYDRTVFFFFEEWKSQAAIDEHFGAAHFKAFAGQLKDLTAGPAEITIYSAPSQKKVE